MFQPNFYKIADTAQPSQKNMCLSNNVLFGEESLNTCSLQLFTKRVREGWETTLLLE